MAQSVLHTTCTLIPGIEQSVSVITLVTTVFADLILPSLILVKICAVRTPVGNKVRMTSFNDWHIAT